MRAHTHTHNQQLYSKWNSAFAHAWVAERLPRQVYDLGEDPPQEGRLSAERVLCAAAKAQASREQPGLRRSRTGAS